VRAAIVRAGIVRAVILPDLIVTQSAFVNDVR